MDPDKEPRIGSRLEGARRPRSTSCRASHPLPERPSRTFHALERSPEIGGCSPLGSNQTAALGNSAGVRCIRPQPTASSRGPDVLLAIALVLPLVLGSACSPPPHHPTKVSTEGLPAKVSQSVEFVLASTIGGS